MPTEQPRVQLEIAHVLFIDIVGYSKLLTNEQRELVRTLNSIVWSTDEFRTADATGKLVRLPTGARHRCNEAQTKTEPSNARWIFPGEQRQFPLPIAPVAQPDRATDF